MKRRQPTKRVEAAARQAVLETAQKLAAMGLSPGRSGNVSMRFGEGMLITPTGMSYDGLAADDIVAVDADGSVPIGARKPSSEWQFHASAYLVRPDRNAVVHAHSMHATVLACARKAIPAFHYMVAAAGGCDIPLVPYATFGTAELARHVAAGLADRDACLLANHGQIAIGIDLASALELAAEVEVLAQQYVGVLALGPANILSAGQMTEVLARFKSYGQRGQE